MHKVMYCAWRGWILSLSLVALILGCSKGATEPTAPTLTTQTDVVAEPSANSVHLWGLWDLTIDPDTGQVEASPIRGAQLTLNVLQFLQPPSSSGNLMTIETDPALTDFETGHVVVDVSLRHPFFYYDRYTGFDVRGICIGNGSVTGIVDPDLHYAGSNDLRVLNADGLTRWFNPDEFKTPGLFGFTKGQFGSDTAIFTATLNGYKYFCDGLSKTTNVVTFFSNTTCVNHRGYFPAGKLLTRRYDIQFPMTGGVPQYNFQYAVVASWEEPSSDPPVVPDDFGINANCQDAYAFSSADVSDMYFESSSHNGGTLRLLVRVFDHQGAAASNVHAEIGAIHLETPNGPIIGGSASFQGAALNAALYTCDDISATYLLEVSSLDLTQAGDLPVLVAIENANPSTYNSGYSGFDYPLSAKLAAYFQTNVHIFSATDPVAVASAVTPPPYYLGDTIEFDASGSYDTDENGDSIVSYEWDFDGDDVYGDSFESGTPAKPQKQFSAIGTFDVNVRVTDDEGDTDVLDQPLAINVTMEDGWALTWGRAGIDRGYAVATDSSGNAYVTGVFSGASVDMDPGTGTDLHDSNGGFDCFLSKFDSSEVFQWARTWGGTSDDYGYGVASDGVSAYVIGRFTGIVDFDPSIGVDNHTSNGNADVFLNKINTNGDFVWTRTWGSTNDDIGYSVSLDSSGNVFTTGSFRDSVDFDPGSGTDNHVTNGSNDIFISKLDSAGNYQWAQTWGGGGSSDAGYDISVNSNGYSFTVGQWGGDPVDFNPGSGVDNHSSRCPGWTYVGVAGFISKFDPNGSFLWARTPTIYYCSSGGFGCSHRSVDVDALDSAIACGPFACTVDLDSGAGSNNVVCNGTNDVLLLKLDSLGNFEWGLSFGGSGDDIAYGLGIDSSGSPYIAGYFNSNVDFDPGTGSDMHGSIGGADVFLSKLNSTGNFQWAKTWGGTATNDHGFGIAVTPLGYSYVTGEFEATVDFDPSAGTDNHSSFGYPPSVYADCFLSKFKPDGSW